MTKTTTKRSETQEQKILRAIEQINNINPDIIQELIELCSKTKSNRVTFLIDTIRNHLNLRAPLNSITLEYWTKRGWCDKLAERKRQEEVKKFKGRLSPFNYKFWMVKHNYDESSARYKANSFRPIRKEYWLNRGHSEEESIKLAADAKHKNNLSGAKKSSNRSSYEMRKSSPRCKEYWMYYKDMNETDAMAEVSKRQATFSLDICIEKYGEEEGIKIWKNRQDRWLATLRNKSDEEVANINALKARSINKEGKEFYLYLIILVNLQGAEYCKIGITNKTSVHTRFQGLIKRGFLIKDVLVFKNLSQCPMVIEQQILKENHDKLAFPKERFDGWTECFKPIYRDFILKEIEKYIQYE
jgi:hypothetical protein